MVGESAAAVLVARELQCNLMMGNALERDALAGRVHERRNVNLSLVGERNAANVALAGW